MVCVCVASLVVGMGGYLPALHEALLGMKEGESKSLTLAPAQAFGECTQYMTAWP